MDNMKQLSSAWEKSPFFDFVIWGYIEWWQERVAEEETISIDFDTD